MKKFSYFLSFVVLALLAACSKETEEDTPTPQQQEENREITLTIKSLNVDIDEKPATGTVIGTPEFTKNPADAIVKFSLNNETVEGALAINETTGEIKVKNGDLFVFDNNPIVSAQMVIKADEGNSEAIASANVVVTIKEPKTIGNTLTIWTGEKMTFEKTDTSDPNEEANQDRITDNVWITRGTSGPIFNIKSETSANKDSSPAGTEWAIGKTTDIATLSFKPFREALGNQRGSFKSVVGKDLVLHLIEDDIYIDVKFTAWSEGRNASGFTYERSTM